MIGCIESRSNWAPVYLMLTMRHTWLRPDLMDSDGDLIDDYSDEDYSFSGDG